MTQSDFNSYISAANNAISPFDLEIRSSYHQITRTRIYALVNSTSDPITQLATTHAADEISFLKRVLDAMFVTYNTQRHEIMAITSMQAVQLAKAPTEDRRQTQNGIETQGSAGQSLTQVQPEKTMNTLVEEGWFEKSQKGFYSLRPRALMELRGWLWETYNDIDDEEEEEDDEGSMSKKIKLCFACKEIITTVRAQRQLGVGFRLKTFFRVNGVRRRHAYAAYTIYVHRASSERSSRRNAHFARQTGPATILLGKEQLLHLRPREGAWAEQQPGGRRQSLWRRRVQR